MVVKPSVLGYRRLDVREDRRRAGRALSARGTVHKRIIEAMHRNADIDARRITVEAIGGHVILGGSVRSWVERREAQRAAWTAPGVTTVDDRITVVP